MNIFIDLIPILVFFVVFKLYGIYVATAASIVIALLQLAIQKKVGIAIKPSQWISTGLICVLGSLTIVLHNEYFIKVKPSVLYLIFAITLVFFKVFLRKDLLRIILGTQLDLPDWVWRRLHSAWIIFFLFLSGLNVLVAFSWETEDWIRFKLFGIPLMTILFFVLQLIVLRKNIKFVHPNSASKNSKKES